MALHVWRAGDAGVHRSVLCQRTELMPGEAALVADVDGTGAAPVSAGKGAGASAAPASGSQRPLQSYFVDSDFTAVATPDVFGGVGRP